MFRRAGPDDVAAMDIFLRAHAETSMFLRGNLAAHGTEEDKHRHGTAFYLSLHDARINGVAGVTNGGFLMCQSDGAPSTFFSAFVDVLRGRKLRGMTGAPAQVRAVFDALGCQNARFTLRDCEPLYALDLSDLRPSCASDVALRPPEQADLDLLADWFAAYHRDTGMTPLDGPDAREQAQHFIADADARVLVLGTRPVAMTRFNARVAEAVQIGGVFVPQDLRGRGFGGAVVALHLCQAAQDGVRKAILFAATPYAAQAYERIGFHRIGSYEIALFADDWMVAS